MSLILYDYWRSSAAYRVRIALKLKHIPYESRPVNLLQSEQLSEEYRTLNPMQAVPMLDTGTHKLTQSIAIMEWLEENYPSPVLLPSTPEARAKARAMSLLVATDIHPLNNQRVLKYLTGPLKQSEETKQNWYAHWIRQGLTALEAFAKESAGIYCIGDHVRMADVCLIPQLYNARRFHCPLDDYPTLVRIEATCNQLPAFIGAIPEKQVDAVITP